LISTSSVLDDEEKYRTGVAKSKSRGETFSAEDLSNFIRTVVATKKQFGEQAVQFQRQLVEFFVERDAPKNADQSFYLNRLIDLVSDVIFNLGIYHEVQLKLAKNWTTYFFVQEYHNYQLHAHRPYEGAYHCNEFPYLYGFSVMGDFEFNTDDYMFKKNLLHSLIRFIKTGEPADEDLNWPPVERNYPSRYLSMTPKPKMKAEYKPQNIHFWTKVLLLLERVKSCTVWRPCSLLLWRTVICVCNVCCVDQMP
uniref:COesterase domain-containing protein n=1 Tax=Toxocara canis TaxID=6265 RepID=A0A183TXG4_TOXCA